MPDLPTTKRAEFVKISGSSTSGVEIIPVAATNKQDLTITDILHPGGIDGNLSVNVGAAVEAKIGGSALTDRKYVILQPLTGNLYWGFGSGVTSTTGAIIYKRQTARIKAPANVPIYITSAVAANDVRIKETP